MRHAWLGCLFMLGCYDLSGLVGPSLDGAANDSGASDAAGLGDLATPNDMTASDLPPTDLADLGGGDVGNLCAQGGASQCSSPPTGTFICNDFDTQWVENSPTEYSCAGGTDMSRYLCDASPQPGNTIGVVGAPVCRGAGALKSATVVQYEASYYARTFPAHSAFYFRAFYYLPTSGSDLGGAHLMLFWELNGSSLTNPFHLNLGNSSVQQLVIGQGSTQTVAAPTIATGRWFCVELFIDEDQTTGGYKLWIDDSVAPVASSTTPVTLDPGTHFVRLALGNSAASTAAANTNYYIDELIMSTSRIGCSR